MLNAETILAAADLPREMVTVPEWGGMVYVRTMTGGERDAWELSLTDGEKRNLSNVRARLAVLVMVDEFGARLFRDDQADALGEKSAAALDRIFDVAIRLNKLSQQDVEDLEKNSVAGQAGNSSSA